MNKESIQRLIDTLRARSTQFDMGHVVQTKKALGLNHLGDTTSTFRGEIMDPNDCGTSCCILGWTNAIANDMQPLERYQFMNVEAAAQFLDLNIFFFNDLCYPFGKSHPWQLAYNMGLLPANPKLINKMLDQPQAAFYPFNATTDQAIAVLEAIRDGVIPSTPYSPPLNDSDN